jgi:hypothetical protein
LLHVVAPGVANGVRQRVACHALPPLRNGGRHPAQAFSLPPPRPPDPTRPGEDPGAAPLAAGSAEAAAVVAAIAASPTADPVELCARAMRATLLIKNGAGAVEDIMRWANITSRFDQRAFNTEGWPMTTEQRRCKEHFNAISNFMKDKLDSPLVEPFKVYVLRDDEALNTDMRWAIATSDTARKALEERLAQDHAAAKVSLHRRLLRGATAVLESSGGYASLASLKAHACPNLDEHLEGVLAESKGTLASFYAPLVYQRGHGPALRHEDVQFIGLAPNVVLYQKKLSNEADEFRAGNDTTWRERGRVIYNMAKEQGYVRVSDAIKQWPPPGGTIAHWARAAEALRDGLGLQLFAWKAREPGVGGPPRLWAAASRDGAESFVEDDRGTITEHVFGDTEFLDASPAGRAAAAAAAGLEPAAAPASAPSSAAAALREEAAPAATAAPAAPAAPAAAAAAAAAPPASSRPKRRASEAAGTDGPRAAPGLAELVECGSGDGVLSRFKPTDFFELTQWCRVAGLSFRLSPRPTIAKLAQRLFEHAQQKLRGEGSGGGE